MSRFIVQLNHSMTDVDCGLCGNPTRPAAGPSLCVETNGSPVCSECGSTYAPSLAALVDLARVAERVGRVGRHMMMPPLEALLDLAEAAEDYAFSAGAQPRAAA